MDGCVGSGSGGYAVWDEEEGLLWDVGVIGECVMRLVHLNSAVEYNLKE